MSVEKRVGIAALAKRYKSEGWKSTDSAEALKPELYALGAVLSDLVVKRAHEKRGERPPFGLIAQTADSLGEGLGFFNQLQYHMRITLNESVETVVSAIEAHDTSPELAASYERLRQLLIQRPVIVHGNRVETPQGFLKKGMNTASKVMAGTLLVILVVGKDKSVEELVQIARSSSSFITNLASKHLETAHPYMQMLGNTNTGLSTPFSFNDFELVGEGDKLRLAISEKGERRLGEEFSASQIGPTIGCPAMVNFGEGSAIKTLWNWHVDIASELYPKFIKPQPQSARS